MKRLAFIAVAFCLAFGIDSQLRLGPSDAHALLFKSIFKKIKKGVRKAVKGVKKAGQKVGQFAKKAANKIKDGLGQALDIAKKLKNKIIDAIKGICRKAFSALKPLVAPILSKVVESLLGKIGFTLEDVQRCVDPQTGEVREKEVRAVIVARVGSLLKPIMVDKITMLVDKGLELIQKPLDAAVSAIIGGVGSIPVAGGAIAAAVSVAYSLGMTALRMLISQLALPFVIDRLVMPLIQKGVAAILNLGGPVKKAFDFIQKKASHSSRMIRLPGAAPAGATAPGTQPPMAAPPTAAPAPAGGR